MDAAVRLHDAYARLHDPASGKHCCVAQYKGNEGPQMDWPRFILIIVRDQKLAYRVST